MVPGTLRGVVPPLESNCCCNWVPPPSTKLQVLLLHGTGYRPQGQNRSCCCVGGGTPPRPAGVVLLRGVVPPMGPSESTATRQTDLFVENGNGICVTALYGNNVYCVFVGAFGAENTFICHLFGAFGAETHSRLFCRRLRRPNSAMMCLFEAFEAFGGEPYFFLNVVASSAPHKLQQHAYAVIFPALKVVRCMMIVLASVVSARGGTPPRGVKELLLHGVWYPPPAPRATAAATGYHPRDQNGNCCC